MPQTITFPRSEKCSLILLRKTVRVWFRISSMASQVTPSLNLPDGIHPNAAGQKILAENVWRALEPIARKVTKGRAAYPNRPWAIEDNRRYLLYHATKATAAMPSHVK